MAPLDDRTRSRATPVKRWLLLAVWCVVAALCLLRFTHLTADFPNFSPWSTDQAKFTDEGWWAGAAIEHHLSGHWTVPGDYNPGVAVPVWPALLALLFHFTGISIVAARALGVSFSIATLGVVGTLVYRHTPGSDLVPTCLAVLLLATSPFAFAFSRLATLDSLTIFEFCLLLLLASFATNQRIWLLATIALLAAAMVLTKTTSACLLPAVFWMLACRLGWSRSGVLRSLLTVVVVPGLLVAAWFGLMQPLGHAPDYRFFFDVNSMPDILWRQTGAMLADLFRHGFWIDRFLYPLGLLVLLASLLCMPLRWPRQLWRNPLFAACCVALLGHSVFLFARQDDTAPRYFLAMLAPLVMVVVLALGQITSQAARAAAFAVLAFTIAANLAMISAFVANPQYELVTAAGSIERIVASEPAHSHLLLGVSAADISLIAGLPSINDAYGTEDLGPKLLDYRPGWYITAMGLPRENAAVLAPFQVDEVARYRIFEDTPDRDILVLFKLTPRAASAPALQPPRP
jgi:hypothetical protein